MTNPGLVQRAVVSIAALHRSCPVCAVLGLLGTRLSWPSLAVGAVAITAVIHCALVAEQRHSESKLLYALAPTPSSHQRARAGMGDVQ